MKLPALQDKLLAQKNAPYLDLFHICTSCKIISKNPTTLHWYMWPVSCNTPYLTVSSVISNMSWTLLDRCLLHHLLTQGSEHLASWQKRSKPVGERGRNTTKSQRFWIYSGVTKDILLSGENGWVRKRSQGCRVSYLNLWKIITWAARKLLKLQSSYIHSSQWFCQSFNTSISCNNRFNIYPTHNRMFCRAERFHLKSLKENWQSSGCSCVLFLDSVCVEIDRNIKLCI